MPLSPIDIALAVMIVAFAAVIQGSVGMGFNIVAVPLTLLIDPRFAPVPMLLSGVLLTGMTVLREPGHVDLRGTGWVLLGRLPGVVAGLALLAVATATTLDVVIGSMVLVAVAIMWFAPTVRRSGPVDFAAGVLSGTSSVVSAIGGPPVGLLFKDERGPTIRATLGAIFTIGATISLVGRALAGRITGTDLWLAAAYVPAVLVGFRISSSINRRTTGARFRTPILVLSAAAAFALLSRQLI